VVDDAFGAPRALGASGGLNLFGPDPGGLVSCGSCGWQGAEPSTGTAGPYGESLASECPRCHAPVTVEMPSIEEIAGARRAPTGD